MEYGPKAELILRQVRDGQPLPKWLAERPELSEYNLLYWFAFQDLGTCRPLGFGGAGPIPWLAILAWADEYRLDASQREDLRYVLSRMDSAYLKWTADESERRSKH